MRVPDSAADDVFVDDLDLLRSRRSVKWMELPAGGISLATAEMDVHPPRTVRAAVLDCLERGDTGYALTAPLEAAFVKFAAGTLGHDLPVDRVRSCPDVLAGIQALLRAWTEPGAEVLLSSPIYGDLATCVREVGRQPVDVPLTRSAGRYRMDLAAVAERFRGGARTWILCNPHNPVGRAWREPELRAALELAAEYDVLVLSNEVHLALSRLDVRTVPVLSLPVADRVRVVALNSASKTFNVAGLKSAVLAAGPRLAADLRDIPQSLLGRPSVLGVAAAEAAFTQEAGWLLRVRAALDGSYRELARLVDRLDIAVELAPAEATYLAWLRIAEVDMSRFTAALRAARVRLIEGTTYGGPAYRNHFRLNFACHPATLRLAFSRIGEALG